MLVVLTQNEDRIKKLINATEPVVMIVNINLIELYNHV